ncbi:protein phosphatase 2C domain-containing protein [Shouchella lonarensis]|nr:protein phosphatase 2C domain-containing protein [Shouchella lonarensis]
MLYKEVKPLFYSWTGKQEPFLSQPTVLSIENTTLGMYGGNVNAGAHKNEDALLLLTGSDWTFGVIIDAHHSSESAACIISELDRHHKNIEEILSRTVSSAITRIDLYMKEMLLSDAFKRKCASVKGEASCLICVQKGQSLWWLSIGDCSLYVFNEELASFHQYRMNQRQFFEFVGENSSLALDVPCYTTGVRELRNGKNVVLLATDGLYHQEDSLFLDDETLSSWITRDGDMKSHFSHILNKIHVENGIDSATLIGWAYENNEQGVYPANHGEGTK